MENQRSILFIALIIVLFLIWQNWAEFKASKVNNLPKDTIETLTHTDDKKFMSDLPNTPKIGNNVVSSLLDSGQRIHVITDVFEVEIDTVGGDIRKVGLRTYPESAEKTNIPFQLIKDSGDEVFIAQSGIINTEDIITPNHHAKFTTNKTEYQLQDGEDTVDVELFWLNPQNGIKVIKSYRFKRNSFLIEINHQVENNSNSVLQLSQYCQFQRTPPISTSYGSGVVTYTGAVISSAEKRYEKITFEDIKKEELHKNIKGGWAAMIQHYFLGAWIPNPDEYSEYYTKASSNNHYILGLRSKIKTIQAGATSNFSNFLYVGPKLPDVLSVLAPNLQLTVDYGVLTFIAEPLFWLLKLIYMFVGNWGWAIIILTMLIKAGFYKLSETSYKSMANMRRLTPELERIKSLYSSDKQKLNQEMMLLYKKEKVNPLGGCLPVLIQIPVFIALYWVLVESVQLRQASFMLWIKDMSVPDPYYVLPIIMGITMLIQQKLSPAPPDPIQAKVMMLLPVVFTGMFLWFPAGLVLYWVVNNILSILQQWFITSKVDGKNYFKLVLKK